MFANPYVKAGGRPREKAPLHPALRFLNGVLQAQKGIGKSLTEICLLNLLSNLHFCLNKNRTTVHLCTTPGSMTMTEMMWVTAVTTAHTTVTQTRQIQTVMERETPVLWTLMEMVSSKDYSMIKVNNCTGYNPYHHLSLFCILNDWILNLDPDYNEEYCMCFLLFSRHTE